MIHYNPDTVQNVVHADLGKFQVDMPNTYLQLRAMGFARKWSIILYPNSSAFPFANKDEMFGCLHDFCVQHNLRGCLSPLHNKDLLLDGSAEEEHYHFFTVSRNPMYAQLIGSLCYFIDGAKNGNIPIIKKVENELGYFRYYTHQDDLDKAEYDSKDIVCFNDYSPPCSGNGSTQSATQELLELLDQFENLTELTRYVVQVRKDLFNVLLRSKNLISTYYSNFDNHGDYH